MSIFVLRNRLIFDSPSSLDGLHKLSYGGKTARVDRKQNPKIPEIEKKAKKSYNKRIINLVCSVCTEKYQISVFFVRTSLRSVRTVKTSV